MNGHLYDPTNVDANAKGNIGLDICKTHALTV